jgi:hypothetical protein
MKIAFLCAKCSEENIFDTEAAGELRCHACRASLKLSVSESIRERGLIDRCAVCSNDRFYVQKDFNRKLGLALVLGGVLLGYLLFGFNMFALIGGLTVCSLLDYLLYKTLPEVTVCYACHSVYRDFKRNPSHKPFDLNVAEEYERHSS